MVANGLPGTCKLTGSKGPMVKSHLIPKAFTRPERPGAGFTQHTSGKPATRRWDSWYDSNLVTREGEDVLSFYDNWATKFLRQEKLVWSSWKDSRLPDDLYQRLGDSHWGIRQILTPEAGLLRLFFLSLLWRAAASELEEFSNITLPPNRLKKLGEMLINRRSEPRSIYPISITQLSTKGIIHNATPIKQMKRVPGGRDQMIYRFYFDGLIAHIHRGKLKDMGDLIVGLENRLTLSTVTYDQSYQRENLSDIISAAVQY
jgi:hypothetical protein